MKPVIPHGGFFAFQGDQVAAAYLAGQLAAEKALRMSSSID